MKNILFYKYVNVKSPEKLREQQFNLCKKLKLKGTILIAKEGINGALSGTEAKIKKYMNLLRKEFSIEFKITKTNQHDFKRLSVRIRKEIVASTLKVNVKKAAPYVEPKQLKEWLDKKEDLILLDVRNNYESEIGKFKNTKTLQLDTFRQLSKKINKINQWKNKKIITYCTGGVRCEKASAFLRENGFNNVFQIRGGIINYGNEVGNAHWQGKCFVFDTRGAIEISNDQVEIISQCTLCNIPSTDFYNCALVSCDKRFIACNSCLKTLKNCCSKNCRNLELLNKTQ